MRIAIYPGSFNPITNGHIDILERALKAFDKVIILVAVNRDKAYVFSSEERVEMIKKSIAQYDNVEVDSTNGLTVEYAKKHNATHIIRGLRAVTDFEYEFQMASTNHFIDPSIDSVFFMSGDDKTFLSSSGVIEMFKNGIDVSSLVPPPVVEKLKEKFQ